jgi:sugar-specific transcriptional regulator TrmB
LKAKLVEKLCAFNLSPNQAKVYAYLCEFCKASISDITDATQIYAQDVYKAVAALEKKGLVLRTKTQPLVIEAIPVEIALHDLLNSLVSDSRRKIETLKEYYKEIAAENKKNLRSIEDKKSDTSSVIVFEKQAPESRIDLAFDRLKEEYDCVLVEGTQNYRKLAVDYGRLHFRKIAKRGVKIKILIIGKETEFTRDVEAKKMMPKNNYEIRTLSTKGLIPCPNLALIDSRELWLSIPSTGKEDALILTDVKEVVEMAKCQFEALWNDPKTKIVAKGSPNGKAVEQILTS